MIKNFTCKSNPFQSGNPQTPQNAAFDQGLHCLRLVQPFPLDTFKSHSLLPDVLELKLDSSSM